MNESRKYEGNWWIPPENDPVCGIAEYTPEDGISLCVFNNFSPSEDNESRFGLREFDLIHGQTVNGENITLKETREVGERNGKPEYNVSALFSGVHLEDEVKFDKLRLEFPLLTDWAGISGLNSSVSVSDDDEASAGDTIQITHTRQEPLELQIDDQNIRFDQNVSTQERWIGKATIEETTHIDVEQRDGRITYDNCLDRAKMFQDLLTLGTGESILPRRMIGINTENDTQKKSEILFYSKNRESYSPPSEFSLHKANFVLADINEDLESALNEWVNVYKELQPLFNSYTAIFDNSYTIDDEYILLSRIFYVYYLATVSPFSDSSDEKWPESFDEILSEIIEENDRIFANLNIDIRSAIDQISERVNYYITYPDNRDTVFDPRRSLDLLIYLRISLIAVLCSEIGVDDERIVQRLNIKYNAVE